MARVEYLSVVCKDYLPILFFLIHDTQLPCMFERKKKNTIPAYGKKKENRTSTMFDPGVWKSTYLLPQSHESHDYVQPLFFFIIK